MAESLIGGVLLVLALVTLRHIGCRDDDAEKIKRIVRQETGERWDNKYGGTPYGIGVWLFLNGDCTQVRWDEFVHLRETSMAPCAYVLEVRRNGLHESQQKPKIYLKSRYWHHRIDISRSYEEGRLREVRAAVYSRGSDSITVRVAVDGSSNQHPIEQLIPELLLVAQWKTAAAYMLDHTRKSALAALSERGRLGELRRFLMVGDGAYASGHRPDFRVVGAKTQEESLVA